MGRIANNPFENYIVDLETGCWNWRGAATKNSYGNVRYGGSWWKAHRLFYAKYVGQIPEGLVVMHQCDNPKCVNPDHLLAGTTWDNMMDCIQKGRHASSRKPLKLTKEQATEIMQSDKSQRQLAEEYGVSRALVWKIKNKEVKVYG